MEGEVVSLTAEVQSDIEGKAKAENRDVIIALVMKLKMLITFQSSTEV